jgi:predicted nucleic acid-binding protein
VGVLIDASILIEHERGRLDLGHRLVGREREELFLSTITASELLHGVHRARDAAQRSRRSAWVEAVIDRFPLLSVDLATARSHARLWAEMAAEGRVIAPHDLWLAAACIAHGLAMATTNVQELRRVHGLHIEDWLA